MGIGSSNPFSSIFKSKAIKLLMLGLDASGKTTILYKLMLNEVVSTISTLGYNVETIQHKHLNLTIWDLAGGENIRAFWKPFYNKCTAIIFVVDSSDRLRIDEAAAELQKLMKEEELKGCSLLVFATKQDCISPMDIPEITDLLGLHDIKDRKWYVQPARTLEGIGINEGLEWLSNRIMEEKKAKSFRISKFTKKNNSNNNKKNQAIKQQ